MSVKKSEAKLSGQFQFSTLSDIRQQWVKQNAISSKYSSKKST